MLINLLDNQTQYSPTFVSIFHDVNVSIELSNTTHMRTVDNSQACITTIEFAINFGVNYNTIKRPRQRHVATVTFHDRIRTRCHRETTLRKAMHITVFF